MSGSLNSVTNVVRSVGPVAKAASDGVIAVESRFSVGEGSLGGLGSDFYDLLQPAAWRGLPFFVLGSRVRAGRRKALHEYPFRDGVWVEDLGKRGRVYGFEGFLVGDDVGDQIASFVESVEKAGPGALVHPTFGAKQCEVVDFDAGEEWNSGRVWRFRIEFLEPVPRGLQLQPAAALDTVGHVNQAADGAEAATSGSFLDKVRSGIGQGIMAVQQAQAAVRPYVATAMRLVSDASRVVNLTRGIAGRFGRYSSGRGIPTSGALGAVTTVRQVQVSVSSAISAASVTRAAVSSAGSTLSAVVDL